MNQVAENLLDTQGHNRILFKIVDLRKLFPIKGGIFNQAVGQIHAVDGVNFELSPGRTLGLVGESGCGKTTLGRCVTGLISPTSGEIMFDLDGDGPTPISNYDKNTMRRFRTKVQIVFQNPYGALNPVKTVDQMLDEPLRSHGIRSRSIRKERIRELLESVNLRPEYSVRFPHEFSGGQRQRVVIARSLTVNPTFLLCDEPVSALDVSVQAQILNLLRRLQHERGLSMIFVSHDLKVVEYISHEIAVMYLGKIVERFPTENLPFALHPYTRALMSAVPDVDIHHRNLARTILAGEIPDPSAPPAGCRFYQRCPLRTKILRKEIQADPNRCIHEEPELRNAGPGHVVACHWYEEEMDPWSKNGQETSK